MASEAQIRANRENALKSTGPKTDDGKRRSRGNAIKHALCASVVVIESLELIQRRASECFFGLKPQDSYQAWLVDQVALQTVRVDRCERMERRARDLASLRACLCWDDDKNLEAKALGARLAGGPELVVEALRRTPHGCDWLSDRWSRLADAARSAGAWTAEQALLAMDLLAIPPAFRDGRKPWDPPIGVGAGVGVGAEVVASGEELVAFATRQLEDLEGRRAVAAEVDEAERALAEADLAENNQPEIRRLRRYESAIHRKLRWYVDQLKNPTPHDAYRQHLVPGRVAVPDPIPDMLPAPVARSADEKAAEGWTPARINPPFDLEPHESPEPGQTADVPAILKDRKRERLARAESRRDARRRKLEKLRA